MEIILIWSEKSLCWEKSAKLDPKPQCFAILKGKNQNEPNQIKLNMYEQNKGHMENSSSGKEAWLHKRLQNHLEFSYLDLNTHSNTIIFCC